MNGEKHKIDLRDTYATTTKNIKKHSYNFLRRYGYWAMIFILFILSIIVSTLTIGDVYELNKLSSSEVIKLYEESGHVVSPTDRVIISDIVVEAMSKDLVIDYNQFNDFLKRVQTYNYELDGVQVRFDTITFYLYTKTKQDIFSFQSLEEWRVALISLNAMLALLTTITFMQTGIQDALGVEFIKDKRKELVNVSKEAAKRRLYAEEYFERLYFTQLKTNRQNLLLGNGMKYEVYFDENGTLKDGLHLQKSERQVISQALRIKIHKLSYNKLVSVSSSHREKDKRRDIKEYKTSSGIRSIVLKILLISMFTFVSVSVIVSSQNGMQVVLNLISSIMAFVAGFLEYLNAYTFITDEYSETLDEQIRELTAFTQWKIPEEVELKMINQEDEETDILEDEEENILELTEGKEIKESKGE